MGVWFLLRSPCASRHRGTSSRRGYLRAAHTTSCATCPAHCSHQTWWGSPRRASGCLCDNSSSGGWSPLAATGMEPRNKHNKESFMSTKGGLKAYRIVSCIRRTFFHGGEYQKSGVRLIYEYSKTRHLFLASHGAECYRHSFPTLKTHPTFILNVIRSQRLP